MVLAEDATLGQLCRCTSSVPGSDNTLRAYNTTVGSTS